tara:strand:+ start:792 stop:1196 length:405 start_codon:yes stop_codon:yes gene_type:complete
MNRTLLLKPLSLIALLCMANNGPPPTINGGWRNPSGTIEVRIAPCNAGLCGVITRASADAIADAKDAGVDNLIGTQLLEDYRPAGANRWTGRVYVPDMKGRFASHMALISPNQLKISGCVLGGLLCRSQSWTRV